MQPKVHATNWEKKYRDQRRRHRVAYRTLQRAFNERGKSMHLQYERSRDDREAVKKLRQDNEILKELLLEYRTTEELSNGNQDLREGLAFTAAIALVAVCGFSFGWVLYYLAGG